MLRRSGADESAIVIRETHDGIHVGDIDPVRVIARWIERNSEGDVQAGSEQTDLGRLAVGGDAVNDFDIASGGFRKEDIAVGSATHQSGVRKTCGEQVNFESGERYGPGVRRTRHHLGRSGGGVGGESSGKVVNGDVVGGTGLFKTVIREWRLRRWSV